MVDLIEVWGALGLKGRKRNSERVEHELLVQFFKKPIGTNIVIPGRAKREPGIHNHDREYGFRACAKMAHPQMRNCASGNDERN
jgi:hypothetical protein